MVRAALLAAGGLCIAAAAAVGHASVPPPAATLTARLSPTAVTAKPSAVRTGAKGRFSASFWRLGAGRQSARFRLTTARLTGPAVTVHIHTGAPRRRGPVLVTICNSGRCRLGGGRLLILNHSTIDSWIETMTLLGGYVDVHTKRNPRGELRGQIEITP